MEKKNAIIMAAGFGSRMVPVTLDTPKPLVKVNGNRFIDTLIDSFLLKGIKDIFVVRGYKKEQFDVLLDKYPHICFINNDEYDKGNNILSIQKALPYLKNTFIAEADLFVSNPDVIDVSARQSYYLARPVESTEDWCFDETDGRLTNYRKGGERCYMACGLSYWNEADCEKLRKNISDALRGGRNRDLFWEFIPFVENPGGYNVVRKNYEKGDIIEIDSFDELCAADPSYKRYCYKK